MEPPPYDPDSVIPVGSEVAPNPGPAKTIGTLNIIFGSLLLLCGVCTGLNLMMQSAMGPMMAVQQQQVQQTLEAERQTELKKLKEQEDAAPDEKTKAELQAKHKALQAQPVPKIPDMSKLMNVPAMQGYLVADVLTGGLLNVLLVVSGVGLLSLKEWSRVTALWVAALKIVRLIALYGYFAMAVAPIMAQQWRAFFEEFTKSMPPGQKGPRPEELDQIVTTMGFMMTGSAVGMMVLGAIYPAIVLIVLTRPRVKAACLAGPGELDD